MLKRIAFAMFFVLFASNAIAAGKTYVAATDPTWPPMEFVSSDKQIVGYTVDYVQAVAKELDITIEFRNVAWDGLFTGLDAGRFDMVAASVTITPDREKVMFFTNPYYTVKQAVILPKDSTITSLKGLEGKTLGAQIGTTGYFAIQKIPGTTAKSYDEISFAMESLYTGRIDGVVCDEPVAADFALSREEYAKKLKIAFIIEDAASENYGIAIKKGNTELRDLLNKGIAQVKAKGIEAELQTKWFGVAQ